MSECDLTGEGARLDYEDTVCRYMQLICAGRQVFRGDKLPKYGIDLYGSGFGDRDYDGRACRAYFHITVTRHHARVAALGAQHFPRTACRICRGCSRYCKCSCQYHVCQPLEFHFASLEPSFPLLHLAARSLGLFGYAKLVISFYTVTIKRAKSKIGAAVHLP